MTNFELGESLAAAVCDAVPDCEVVSDSIPYTPEIHQNTGNEENTDNGVSLTPSGKCFHVTMSPGSSQGTMSMASVVGSDINSGDTELDEPLDKERNLDDLITDGGGLSEKSFGRACIRGNIGDLILENGDVIPDVSMIYETWGTMNEDASNVMLVLPPFSFNSHVSASDLDSKGGWWPFIVGPGKAIDSTKHFVVCIDSLGDCQGSTGPASIHPDGRIWGSRFPFFTLRDMVRAEALLIQSLGIKRLSVVGASLGGFRAIEWGVMAPEFGLELNELIIVGATAQTTGDCIAWAHLQKLAIVLDPHFENGDFLEKNTRPIEGLRVAREIALTTYRSRQDFSSGIFGRQAQRGEDPLQGGRYAVSGYLDYQGTKFAPSYDANSYLRLNHTVMTHDISRGRGTVEEVLQGIHARRVLIVAMELDRLCWLDESELMAKNIPNAELVIIPSRYGHVAFLVEDKLMTECIGKFLS